MLHNKQLQIFSGLQQERFIHSLILHVHHILAWNPVPYHLHSHMLTEHQLECPWPLRQGEGRVENHELILKCFHLEVTQSLVSVSHKATPNFKGKGKCNSCVCLNGEKNWKFVKQDSYPPYKSEKGYVTESLRSERTLETIKSFHIHYYSKNILTTGMTAL